MEKFSNVSVGAKASRAILISGTAVKSCSGTWVAIAVPVPPIVPGPPSFCSQPMPLKHIVSAATLHGGATRLFHIDVTSTTIMIVQMPEVARCRVCPQPGGPPRSAPAVHRNPRVVRFPSGGAPTAEPLHEEVRHQPGVPPVAVRKRMDCHEPVMQTDGDFIRWIGRMLNPVAYIAEHVGEFDWNSVRLDADVSFGLPVVLAELQTSPNMRLWSGFCTKASFSNPPALAPRRRRAQAAPLTMFCCGLSCHRLIKRIKYHIVL